MQIPFRRPPTPIERLLGKRRARMLRRRLGVVAVGAGISLLKPSGGWTRMATMVALGATAIGLIAVLH